MSALVDTSILIDYLRGHTGAADLLASSGRLVSCVPARSPTRVLAGMRPSEEEQTRSLLSALVWHPVDDEVAEEAGALGRRRLPSHSVIDGADLAIAATTLLTGPELLTLYVRHFPMFAELRRPY